MAFWQGILEPTKDQASAVCSPEHKSDAANTPPERKETVALAADRVQASL